jgi:hypothetical protein
LVAVDLTSFLLIIFVAFSGDRRCRECRFGDRSQMFVDEYGSRRNQQADNKPLSLSEQSDVSICGGAAPRRASWVLH